MKSSSRFLLLCAGIACAVWARAQDHPAPPGTSPKFSGPLREPPDRPADALHLKLRVTLDWEKREVAGTVSHSFRALRNLRSLTLDSVGIHVLQVTTPGGKALKFESQPETLRIYLDRDFRRGEEIRFTIRYRASPDRGLYFRAPDGDYPGIPRQVWTQGEAIEHRHWIPCFDHPCDKLTSEVIVTAPEGMVGLSNGRLVGDPVPAPGGGRVFHWSQEKPHSVYLIALVVGDFAVWRDEWEGIPLVAYVPRDQAQNAGRSFAHTADMCRFYSEKTGIPYPWPRYGQVCVRDFVVGGMENTGLTLLTDQTLHDATAALDVESLGLVAHELAHQWFGDLVTCKDWAEIWLNESFAVFFENLYVEELRGWDEGVYDRMLDGEKYLEEARNEYRRPLVTYRYRSPGDLFDAHTYPKGGRILSMLRYVLGDERFFAGIRLYLKRHAYQTVETSDFREAMEDASGSSLRWFFRQWIHRGGHPHYGVEAEWDSGMLRVRVRQLQAVDSITPLFRMPLEIEVRGPSGPTIYRVDVEDAEETFQFPVRERPMQVRFDPRDWILKELDFPRSREELLYQLRNDPEISGRIEAARGLEEYPDDVVRAALLERLVEDPFWGVRLRVARVLKKSGGEQVRDGLIKAYSGEKKAPVRREIVQSLGEYPGAVTADFLREVEKNEPSYFVVGDALRALYRIDPGGALPDALNALRRDSHGEEIRIAALEAISRNGPPEGTERERVIGILLEQHRRGKPTPVRIAAGHALARIGRGSGRVYRALAAAVNDPSPKIRYNLFEDLADFGDRRAIELLRNRRGMEGRRIRWDLLDAIDRAVKRLEAVGETDQVLRELQGLRKERERLEGRIRALEEKVKVRAF